MLGKLITACLVGSAVASPFRVFDNTAYTNTSIGYGTTNINWIPAYVCNPLTEGGLLPAEETWKEIVLQWNVYPGYPLVLDCEAIYFTSTSTADRYLNIMSTLQTWAADVVPPDQIIGWYGLSGNTLSSLYGHYRSLIANHSNHAFFPSAYTFTSSFATWNTSLASVLDKIKQIDDTLPVWPYMWPQYHGNYSFYPAELWKDQLDALAYNTGVDGLVVWGGKNHAVCDDACQVVAGQQPWLSATRSWLVELYGLYTGGSGHDGAQLFS